MNNSPWNIFNIDWEEVNTTRHLLVITMGLGGPQPSYYLYNYLKENAKNYDQVEIYAFGKDENAGRNSISSSNLLRGIESLSKNYIGYPFENKFMKASFTVDTPIDGLYTRENFPITVNDFRTTEEFITIFLDLQLDGETYKYFVGKEFKYYNIINGEEKEIDGNARSKNEKFFNIFETFLGNYLKTYPNGTILIDNNAFIRGSPYYNMNFEYMPWMPQILAKLNQDEKIFQLEKIGSQHAKQVPFFSREAVYKLPVSMLIYEKFNELGLRDKLMRTANSIEEDRDKRKYLLDLYRCMKSGIVFTRIPDPSEIACPAVADAAAGGAAAGGAAAGGAAAGGAAAPGAAAPVGGTVGGARRVTRQRRRQRRQSRRKHLNSRS